MIFFLVMALVGVCFGAVYRVGDSEGWRYKGFDYQAWRLDKNFTVGDSLGKFFLFLLIFPLNFMYLRQNTLVIEH